MKCLLSLFLCFSFSLLFAWELVPYRGTSFGVMMPGGGSSYQEAYEQTLTVGTTLTPFVAIEGVAHLAPNASFRGGHQDFYGLGLQALYHFTGFDWYDKLFGCERVDPFLTAGGLARWNAHRKLAGPAVGIGCYYHLTEQFDVRFDAQLQTCCASPMGVFWTCGVGLEWNFGGDE